jgi:hypothetical protein
MTEAQHRRSLGNGIEHDSLVCPILAQIDSISVIVRYVLKDAILVEITNVAPIDVEVSTSFDCYNLVSESRVTRRAKQALAYLRGNCD